MHGLGTSVLSKANFHHKIDFIPTYYRHHSFVKKKNIKIRINMNKKVVTCLRLFSPWKLTYKIKVRNGKSFQKIIILSANWIQTEWNKNKKVKYSKNAHINLFYKFCWTLFSFKEIVIGKVDKILSIILIHNFCTNIYLSNMKTYTNYTNYSILFYELHDRLKTCFLRNKRLYIVNSFIDFAANTKINTLRKFLRSDWIRTSICCQAGATFLSTELQNESPDPAIFSMCLSPNNCIDFLASS